MDGSILIRVDGNSELGLGHIVRCVALAQMLKGNFLIHFICKYVPEEIEEQIRLQGFKLSRISSEHEFTTLLDNEKIVVLDGYKFTFDTQSGITKKGALLVFIDDLHNTKCDADLIINHAPGVSARDYDAQAWTKYALGPEYSLLRPSFLNAEKKVRPQLRTILICFGGADPKNLTKRVLEVVTGFDAFIQITVVTGPAYTFYNELIPIIESDKRIFYFHSLNEKEMAEQLQKTDVAVVPASGVLLEAMACGAIPMSGMYAENQRELYENYKLQNCFIDANEFSGEDLLMAVRETLNGNRIDLNSLIDGKSGERILKLIQQLQHEKRLHIRTALRDDLDITFKWATDPRVRQYSFSKTPILRQQHEAWFHSKLNSPNTFYYIAQMENRAIGSIRFDVSQREAVVSYLLDPSTHGKGLGVVVVTLGIKILVRNVKSRAFDKITAYIMADNIPSIRTFERLGFSRTLSEGSLKFEKNILS